MLSPSLSREARRQITKRIHLSIENWYMQWCLLPPGDDSDSVFVQNTVTWISARYYYLLMLLYYPTYFNLCGDDFLSSSEPVAFASKYVQSLDILLQQHQVHLSRITLARVLPAALILTYGFGNGAPHPVISDVALLIRIFDSFDSSWTHAHRAANILRGFDLYSRETDRITPIRYYDNIHESNSMKAKQLWADLLGLVQEVLGPSSSFCWALAEHAQMQTRRQIGPRISSQVYQSSGRGDGTGLMGSLGLGHEFSSLGSFDLDNVRGSSESSSPWRQPLNPILGDAFWQFDA